MKQAALFVSRKRSKLEGRWQRPCEPSGCSWGRTTCSAYMSMMAPRLVELRRVLKPTGSLYLHCDPTASHYLKLLLDAVFWTIFTSCDEIVWKRHNARSTGNRWPRIHDTLLFVSKSDEFYVQPSQGVGRVRAKISTHAPFTGSEYGRKYIQTYELTPMGGSVTKEGDSWKIPDSGAIYDYPLRWAGTGAIRTYHPHPNGWDACDLALIHWYDTEDRAGGFPTNPKGALRLKDVSGRIRRHRKVTVGDVWTDISVIRINQAAKERLGYPTQKPVALLERIIQASSNEGDTILDPFCGCGTTVAAAQKFDRRWIGIDITQLAISLIRYRLGDSFGKNCRFEVIGEPTSTPGCRRSSEGGPLSIPVVDSRSGQSPTRRTEEGSRSGY